MTARLKYGFSQTSLSMRKFSINIVWSEKFDVENTLSRRLITDVKNPSWMSFLKI